MRELLRIVRILRSPEGCPWDRRQTHASLRAYLTEEAAEAVDAISRGDDAATRDELGDVLLQVALHAAIAEERGAFDYRAVERGAVAKMVRRHPHVFGEDGRPIGERDGSAPDDAELHARWDAIKAAERAADAGDASGAGGDDDSGGSGDAPWRRVPGSLPALARAAALARAMGWDAARDPLGSTEAAETGADAPDLLGEQLLALAIRAARSGHDPETLLRDAAEARLAAEIGSAGAGGGAANAVGPAEAERT